MKEVEQFLLHELCLKDGDNIVIGVSGGPDSMALLNIVSQLRNQVKFNIICAHVNHKVRLASDSEQEFVSAYCKKNHIILEVLQINNYSHDNFHNQAREKRYHFFEQLVKKYHAQYLFTAHHGDDLIETILMRIIRGSTLSGYAGFSRITERKQYQIVRPLIKITKDEIIDYLTKEHIEWVTDDSNQKDVYTRNRVRKYLVSQLKKENPNIHHKFYKFSNLLLDSNEYIVKQAKKELSNVYHDNVLYLNDFSKLDKIIQVNILNLILADYYKDNLTLINNKHVNLILEAIHNNHANFSMNLPGGIIVNKAYHILQFLKENETKNSYFYEFDNNISLPNGKSIIKVESEERNGNDVCRLNSGDIVLPLYIRTRQSGDIMSVKGLSGRRKIKDILIDEKIPIYDRNEWPIVVDSMGTIVWLPGIKKSKFNKQKDEKYDIILKYN